MTARWHLGEVFILRHAGFPFDWLESLGVSAGFATLARSLLEAEEALVAAAPEGARERVRAELAAGRLPVRPRGAGGGWEEAAAGWSGRRKEAEAGYAEERARLRRALRERAADLRVQEAVFLSSPDMYENVWARALQSPAGAETADARRAERQMYSYLQRLCGKNETTSFFGPMGYGVVEGEDDALEVTRLPGPQRRRTFLAFWAVQELARAIGREPSLRHALPLRLNPVFQLRLEGAAPEAGCRALEARLPLTADQTRALAALRERPRPLAELAGAMGWDASTLERALAPLMKAALVVRRLQFEAEELEAFTHLRRAVAALPALPARERWTASLEELDGLRAAFERADLPGRRALLPRLEAAFTTLTQVPARRGEGQMYSDRLVLYEEASSPFALRMGKAFARGLEEALSGGLERSAAFGARVQAQYAAEVDRKLGPSLPLDLLSYAARLRPDQVAGSEFSPVTPVGAGELAALPAAGAGARYALPDVCLGRREGGPFEVVLARVHHHLLLWSWLCAFAPDRARVERVAREWLEREPGASGLTALAFTRRNKGFYRYPGAKVAYTVAGALDAGEGTLSASSLTVARGEGGPELRAPDGRRLWLYLSLADFSTYPPFAALAHPLVLHAPIRGPAHQEAVVLGGAVYQRQRWEAALPGMQKRSGLDLFLSVQRLRHALRWPRFLFARVKDERKPFLLDCDSPFAVELLRHLLSGSGELSCEEMQPRPEELWLEDEAGRYTFELRMQATRPG